MKYSDKFNRDYNWYLKWADLFNFDGSGDTGGKVIPSEVGKSAKECFYIFDSKGKILPTNQPELLYKIHKCKGAINFNIKMWAESRGKGEIGKLEFLETIAKEYELLDWMIDAVENQRKNYWPV